MIEYNFCPKCSTTLVSKNGGAYCSTCDYLYFQNSAPCASIFIIQDGKVLMGYRAKEPFKGALDVLGGFLEYNEEPPVGAIREAKEETGLDIELVDIIGAYADTYGDGGKAIINIQYVARSIGGEEKAQDDVAQLKWFKVEDVPEDEGFDANKRAIKDLKKWYKNNSHRF